MQKRSTLSLNNNHLGKISLKYINFISFEHWCVFDTVPLSHEKFKLFKKQIESVMDANSGISAWFLRLFDKNSLNSC